MPDLNKGTLRLATVPALVVLLSSTLQLAWGQPADAPAGDPNIANPNEIVTVAVQDYAISGLGTRLRDAKAFKYGSRPFPRLSGDHAAARGGRAAAIRASRQLPRALAPVLAGRGAAVVVVDAPSDQWATFIQQFRETPRYGADVAALLTEITHRFGVAEWTFVGTSEGFISAFHGAHEPGARAARDSHVVSVFAFAYGPGLSRASWEGLYAPLLWVHHEDDPCQFTSYRDAKGFAGQSRSPLVTVRGRRAGRGGACEAFTAHGFVGIESETVAAMRSWVKTGAAPRDVQR